ncbi:MAG: phospholipase [Alphaproteobacteria bacterium]|nr:phospholipase [Alphaproteobacteria bacterium]
MTRTVLLDGPRAKPAAGGPVRQLVILLHGYGADGDDLFGLVPELARSLPDAAFASPHAPEPCGAGFGYQWFPITNLMPAAMLAGVQDAAPSLERFIEAERDRYDLDDSQVALVGFSQGTMMSLYVGLRRSQPLAAIVGFSGTLVGADTIARGRAHPPVLLVHGSADPLVPVLALHDAVRGLKAAEVAVEWEIRPGLPHAIDPEGLRRAAAFLKAKLPA